MPEVDEALKPEPIIPIKELMADIIRFSVGPDAILSRSLMVSAQVEKEYIIVQRLWKRTRDLDFHHPI